MYSNLCSCHIRFSFLITNHCYFHHFSPTCPDLGESFTPITVLECSPKCTSSDNVSSHAGQTAWGYDVIQSLQPDCITLAIRIDCMTQSTAYEYTVIASSSLITSATTSYPSNWYEGIHFHSEQLSNLFHLECVTSSLKILKSSHLRNLQPNSL